jgi:hypothetical protein
MRSSKWIAVTLLAVSAFIITSSCGEQNIGWKGTIKEVEGVTYVRNPKEGLWNSQAKADVVFVEECHIEELDGPEEYLFVAISIA